MSTQKTVISFHRDGGESLVLGNGEWDVPIHLLEGSQGLGVAPPSFAAAQIPGGNGSLLRGKRLDERELFIPVLVEADSPEGLQAQKDRLLRVLSPVDTRPLWLRVQPAGRDDWREIRVHYAGGLQGDYGSEAGLYHEALGLQFKSFQAFWSGQEVVISRQVAPATKHFLSTTQNFFPVELSDSVVDAQLTFDVAGDAPTFPVWTIVPPGSDLNIVHATSGSSFNFTGQLTQTLTIDMGAERLTSAGSTPEELWSRVSIASRPFGLPPGRNVLDFALIGASTASMVHLTYRPQFLTGH